VEAITFLSWLRSFRTSRTADLVSHGLEAAYLAGSVEGVRGDHRMEVTINRGFRRALMDGNPVRSARECLNEFTVAFLSPDDPAILEGGPSGRRTLVDRFVVLLDPGRLPLFQTYSRLVRQRNEILKAPGTGWDGAVLDACEEALADAGGKVVAARKDALARLLEHLPNLLTQLAGPDLKARVSYTSRWLTDECAQGGEGALLSRRLASRRQADAAQGRTTVGPHTDDLTVEIQGHAARGHASRGQRKALMLAWKAAEVRVFSAQGGGVPVLVLDDALADLDDERQGMVLDYLATYPGQSFLTGTAVPGRLADDCTVFRAQAGAFHSGA